ncbi:hypothetical protein [Borrelia coriaceae]|uniref:Putative cytosolic protein n=1 Tax=Borrelia coriaceae ATCC 43381 TaxID=1408429 RepID=W5SX87_9SPIR|nr:hypothetical protein [Borrelia coriaceae]AHH11510.1 Putative cytosolic protein [Borrelia coriaceae ATCC 43381]
MDTIKSQAKDAFTDSLSQESSLTDDHSFITLYGYSSFKKIKVQKHLTGLSSSFNINSTTTIKPPSYSSGDGYYRNTVSMSSLKYGRYIFDFEDSDKRNQHAEIIIEADSSDDDKPIYLIVKVEAISSSHREANKIVSIKYRYSSSSQKRGLFRLSSVNGGVGFHGNILEGWYMQKNVSGTPLLVKL